VQHIPLIISGPGIRRGLHSAFPARPIDLAPTMEYLLGLPATPRPGLLLADALVSPPHGAVSALRSRGNVLGPMVSGLQAQSRWDSGGWRTPSLKFSPPAYTCRPKPKSRTRCNLSPHSGTAGISGLRTPALPSIAPPATNE
jgi:hypothetical protein